MQHLKTVGLCLVSMFAMSMALAGNASAATLLWLLCLKTGTSGVAPTKYESNQCTKTNTALEGEWESVGLPSGSGATVRLLAYTLRLTDLGTGISILCPDSGPGWGLIESGKIIGKVAELKSPEAEGCKLEGQLLTCAAGKLESMEAIHMPWTSEIFETEGKYLAKAKATGGRPGWAIKCGGVTDTCEESTEKPESAEVRSGVTKGVLLVLARGEGRGKQNCSIGGSGQGELVGTGAGLLWNGDGLSLTTL